MNFTPNFSKKEWKSGLIALTLVMFLLPNLLALVPGLSGARLSLAAYLLSAITAVRCLRRYLGKNLTAALDHPFFTIYFAILGYLANMVLTQMMGYTAYWVLPRYVNYNNQVIESMMSAELTRMLLTTVVLAPIAEECFFRGLLFRGMYDRSPWAAWTLSVGLFAIAHVVGFIGVYTPLELLLSLLIYVPSGVVLCVTYQRSGNLICPILAHALINLMAALAATR